MLNWKFHSLFALVIVICVQLTSLKNDVQFEMISF